MPGYILLNGVSSAEHGLELESARPLILPRRTRERETLPGRLSAIEGPWNHHPTEIRLGLVTGGPNKAEAVNRMQAATTWLMHGSELRLWYDTTKYYLGGIDGEPEFSALSRNYWRLGVDFMCNPPCWHKVRSKQAGWDPVAGVPIPEQITPATETVSRSGAGDLPVVSYAAAYPAALYFAITGTWTSLALGGAGGLVLNWPTPQSMTVYIDCEAQQVYHKLGGVMTTLMGFCSGDFPALSTTGAISVAGSNFSATTRLFLIERG